MKTNTFIKYVSFNENGISGKGVQITEEGFEELTKIYFQWKELNESLSLNFDSRRINIPEILSEGMACFTEDWLRTNNTLIKGFEGSSFDAVDLMNRRSVQIKACSTLDGKTAGPTSFGPKSKFDSLFFMHFNTEKDIIECFFIEDNYKNFKVNAKETLAEQQARGIRPRITLLNYVQKNKIPVYKSIELVKK